MPTDDLPEPKHASDESYVEELLHFLCAEPRPAGSARNAVVRDEILRRYREMGYTTNVAPVEMTGWELREPVHVELLTPIQRTLQNCFPVVWSGATPGAISGRVQPRWPGVPARITTFEAYMWEVLPVVTETGAVAAWLLLADTIWPQCRNDSLDPTPCVLVGGENARFILHSLRNRGPVHVRLSLQGRFLPGQQAHNIIAESSAEPSILVTAHYDSFFTTTGAHDNASGTAALLCLARRLARAPLDHVRIISFDAEEFNKTGSYGYVENLARTGELDRIRAVINIDSVGIGRRIFFLVPAMHRAAIDEALRRGQASATGSRKKPTGGYDLQASTALHPFDSWPFHKKGVKALQVGTKASRSFPWFHQPGDALSAFDAGSIDTICEVASLVELLLRYWKPR